MGCYPWISIYLVMDGHYLPLLCLVIQQSICQSNFVGGVKVKCVDTTGVGDAFVGGLLLNLAVNTQLFKDEKKLRDALRFANVRGAITVTVRGAIPSLLSKEDISLILDNLRSFAYGFWTKVPA